MTGPPDSPPQVFDSLEDAVRALRAEGLRVTTPRRLVLGALFAAEGPVSAARLAETLSLDESSVYRNLEVLEQRGVARHLHLGHSPGLYALARREPAEYLYCERCAKVTVAAPGKLDGARRAVRRAVGYTPSFEHFALVGVCPECAGADAPAAADALHSHGGYVHAHAASGTHRH